MRVHHLAFRTDDVDRLVVFYQTTLGLEVVRRSSAHSVWLALGEARLMIEARAEGETRVADGTLELVAFAVDEGSRQRLRATLVQAGLLEAETEHTLYFRDPDGRRIGVSSYPFD